MTKCEEARLELDASGHARDYLLSNTEFLNDHDWLLDEDHDWLEIDDYCKLRFCGASQWTRDQDRDPHTGLPYDDNISDKMAADGRDPNCGLWPELCVHLAAQKNSVNLLRGLLKTFGLVRNVLIRSSHSSRNMKEKFVVYRTFVPDTDDDASLDEDTNKLATSILLMLQVTHWRCAPWAR